MLAAKRDLELPRMLRKLDNFDLLVIDDLGYLPQGAEESEVLFTLIAERYERRSLGIASNLVFSEWEKVYANPMATAAAIDRIVHHSVILEFDVPSYRTNAAQNRRTEEGSDRPKCLTWITLRLWRLRCPFSAAANRRRALCVPWVRHTPSNVNDRCSRVPHPPSSTSAGRPEAAVLSRARGRNRPVGNVFRPAEKVVAFWRLPPGSRC